MTSLPMRSPERNPQLVHLDIHTGVEVGSTSVPDDLLRVWLRACTIDNPAYAAAIRAGRYTREPRVLRGYDYIQGGLRFARGAAYRLRMLAAQHGIELTWCDQRVAGELLELEHRRELRDYQTRAVAELANRQQAIAVAPAGAGKTTLAIGLIAAARCSTLILVGTIDLAEQWRAEIREQLGYEAGIIGAGKYDVRPITVALVPSLAQLSDVELTALHARFGVLIVDECHHSAAPQWWRVISASPARHRVGLTATLARQDGLDPLLGWLFGRVIRVADHATLLDEGRLVPPRVIELQTEFVYAYRDQDDWQPMLEELVGDHGRNRLIIEHVVAAARTGHSVLVLTGRVNHAEQLARALAERGVRAAALHGKTPKKQRAALLESAKSGDLSVLVSTQLADEGLDLPRLSRLYLTFPAKSPGRVEQRLGRVMRPAPGKLDPAVIDVVDVKVGVLRHQARKRREVFREVLGAHG